MPTIKNISPYGALDIPLLRRVVDAGEEVEVTTEQAKVLLAQTENYEAVKPAKSTQKKAAA